MKINWKEALTFIRGVVRPYLAFIFPTAVVVIGAVAVFKLLAVASGFVDRDLGQSIITVILTIITAIVTSSGMIMAFYFGERAGKKKEEK